MRLESRVEILEKESRPEEQETIIPRYKTPDTCVFCTDNYDSVFYFIFRTAYNCHKKKEFEKQNKKTCIHNTDDWLKHSLYSAGFLCSAIDGNNMKYYEIMEIFKDKRQRETLLTKKYNESKNYSTACDLYLPKSSGVNTEKRYTTSAFTIEDDIPIQNKIIQNKIKIYYNKAVEVLRNFDNEKEVESCHAESSK